MPAMPLSFTTASKQRFVLLLFLCAGSFDVGVRAQPPGQIRRLPVVSPVTHAETINDLRHVASSVPATAGGSAFRSTFPPTVTGREEFVYASPALASLSLNEAFAMAEAANREVVASQFDTSAAIDRLAAIKGKDAPTLSFFADYSLLSDEVALASRGLPGNIAVSENHFAVLGGNVSIPIYRGGKAAVEQQIGWIDIQLAELRTRQMQRLLRLQVVEAFTHVLMCQSQLRLAHGEMLYSQSHAHDASRSKVAGAISSVDELKVRAAMAAAASQQEAAQALLAEARYALNRLLGQPTDQTVDLHAPQLPPICPAVNDWLSAAMTNREELVQLRASVEQLQRQADALRREGDPQVYLRGNAFVHDNDFVDPNSLASVSLSVDWDLFDGKRRENQAAALEKNATGVAMNLADVQSKIEVEVRAALRKWQASGAAVQAAMANVDYQNAARASAEQRRSQGMATRTELLAIQRDVASAEHGYNEAVLNAIVLGHRLRFAAGL